MATRKGAENGFAEGRLLQLIHSAGQAADAQFAERRGGVVTPRQYAVLAVVAESDGLIQAQICQLTGIDRSTTANLVARLVRRKLLRRIRSRSDARAWIVRLGKRGAAAVSAAEKKMRNAEQAILSGLQAMQREEFLAALRALAYHPTSGSAARHSEASSRH